MFKRKNYFIAILLMLSFSCFAEESVWKESYQLEAKANYQQAASKLSSLLESNNEYAILRYAYLNYMQGEFNDAIHYYKKAIELNPASIDAKLGITLPLMAQKRWRQVKLYTHQVLTLSHWNYTAHVRLMIAEEGQRQWTTLAGHAAQLSKAYPSDTTALVYLARAYAWQDNKADAKKIYNDVLIRVPGHYEATAYLKNN